MKNNQIKIFTIGIVVGIGSIMLIVNIAQFMKLSTDTSVLEARINILSNILTTVLSAWVAFLVAQFQVQKEKAIQDQNDFKKNIRYLRIIKSELDISKFNVQKVQLNSEGFNAELFLEHIERIIPMESWSTLYLEIDISEETYQRMYTLSRAYIKIKSMPYSEFDIDDVKNLLLPLTEAVNSIDNEIMICKEKIDFLNNE